jgi:hypothetical protein
MGVTCTKLGSYLTIWRFGRFPYVMAWTFDVSLMTLLGFHSVLGGRLKSVRSLLIGGHLMILGGLLHFCKGHSVFLCMSAMRLSDR